MFSLVLHPLALSIVDELSAVENCPILGEEGTFKPPGVGTECTLVHCSLYTGCIYRVLTPRELRNQVVNLHCICNTWRCQAEITW
jgi:hypothetical protein